MKETYTRQRMRKLSVWSTASVFLSLTLCSCGTLANKLVVGPGNPYVGIEADETTIKCGSALTVFGVIDFPFSLVADTLFLPLDLAMKKDEKPQFGCHP